MARSQRINPDLESDMRTVVITSLLSIALLVPATVQAQAQSSNPYTLPLLIRLLEGGFSGEEVLRRVNAACISFRMNASAEADLRKAGADDVLIRELQSSVCYRGVAAPPPQPRGIVSIEGELPAGWSRIVNELPPSINREIDLTPNRPAVITVNAPGFCSDRTERTLAPGDTVRWTPTLRGRPWVGGC
jgi:hypothetical protein